MMFLGVMRKKNMVRMRKKDSLFCYQGGSAIGSAIRSSILVVVCVISDLQNKARSRFARMLLAMLVVEMRES